MGGPFYKKCWNSKILVAPPASPTFRPRFLGLWAKNQNSAPNIFFALLSQFRKGATQPPCPKTMGGDRFGRKPTFRGPGLTPRAPRVPREGWKSKGKIGFFYRRVPPQNQILRTFCFIQLFDLTHPWGATGLWNPQKRGVFPSLLNKSWEFGGLA